MKNVEVKASNLMSAGSSGFKQHFKFGGAADDKPPKGWGVEGIGHKDRLRCLSL